MLGLPDGISGCLFDLDGVLTQTARVHAAAWQEMFDSFLRDWSKNSGAPFAPFDPVKDYDQYVDGKPREDGTVPPRIPWHQLAGGSPDDPPGAPTIHGLSSGR